MTYAQAGRHATWMRGCTHSPIGDANISTSNSNSGGRFRAMSSAMGSRSAPCHSQVCGKYMCFDFSPARLASVCLSMPEGAQQNSCSAVQVEYLATPMRQPHSPVPLPARPRTRSGTWHEASTNSALSHATRPHICRQVALICPEHSPSALQNPHGAWLFPTSVFSLPGSGPGVPFLCSSTCSQPKKNWQTHQTNA